MKILKLLIAMTMILPSLSYAEENKRVEIGTRSMSQDALEEIEKRKTANVEDQEDGEIASAGFFIDYYPPIYYSSSYHCLTAITILNNDEYSLELEDGSIWKISSYDGIKALNWRINDPLIITQNNRWFSRHNYKIINMDPSSKGTSVEATLSFGPIEFGEFSRFIVGIDSSNGEILLSDSTQWKISYLDKSLFKDWAINDYIIIGTNSNTSIWDSGSDALLLNVNLNNACRAKQL